MHVFQWFHIVHMWCRFSFWLDSLHALRPALFMLFTENECFRESVSVCARVHHIVLDRLWYRMCSWNGQQTHTRARNGTRRKASGGWCVACCRVRTAQFVYVNMYFIYLSIPYDKSTKSSPPATSPLSRFLLPFPLVATFSIEYFSLFQIIIMIFLFFWGFVWMSLVLLLLLHLTGWYEFIHKH